jgi:hypothetical protein
MARLSKKENKTKTRNLHTSGRIRKLTRKQKKSERKKGEKLNQLPSSWQVLRLALKQLYRQKRLFLGILAVYTVLSLLFVRGISSNFQLDILKQEIAETFGDLGKFGLGVTLYSQLLSNAASVPSEVAGAYQTIFAILISLALIWALRQTYEGKTDFKVKETFYKSMTPLIPFLVVASLVALQLMPALITLALYSSAREVIVTGAEQLAWTLVMVGGVGTSVYFLSSSVFALYIVTLPDSTPWQSLKTAKKLVKFRRWLILRKLLFLPFILLLFSAVILIPLIIFVPKLAEILFFIFNVAIIAIIHAYFYNLYRKLI